jgi:hypothetical protein
MRGIRLTTEQFIERAIEKHGNKYDYSETIYRSANDKVLIYCYLHGQYKQRAWSHISGSGCPKCNSSGIILAKRWDLEYL